METLKLRLSLFRIWFVKNIIVFLEILAIVLFILVFTGVLPTSTPIFGDLILEIRKAEGDSSRWVHVLSVFISCFTSVAVFMTRVKNIALSDIKSDNLKVSMIQAGLYFNDKGQLTKKLEKATHTDIDGDGEIADTGEPASSVGFFRGIKNAVTEFFAIATVKLDDENKTVEEVFNETVEKNDMKDAAELVSEISEKKQEIKQADAIEKVDAAENAVIESVRTNDELTAEEKEVQIAMTKHFGARLRAFFRRIFRVKTKEEKEEARAKKLAKKEAVKAKKETKKQAKLEKANAKKAKKIAAEKTPEIKKEVKTQKVEPVKDAVKPTVKAEVKPVAVKKTDAVDNFLAGIRR